MATSGQNIEWYARNFELLEKSLNGESKLPIHATRRRAFSRLVELGFPTTRHEEWRFTNITPIKNSSFAPVLELQEGQVPQAQVEKLFVTGNKNTRLVFINGHYSEKFSNRVKLSKSIFAGSLREALQKNDPTVSQHLTRYVSIQDNAFGALSTAFIQDGAYVRVGDGIEVEEPIECLFMTTSAGQPVISNPRNLIVVGNDSSVTIVESYVGIDDSTYLDNVVSEVVVGERATVEHDRLQMEGARGFHIGSIHVQQSERSKYVNNAISLGGQIARNNITAVLAAEGAESTLNGLSLATGDQLIDNHTTIDHTKPNCTSHELYKSILDGKARGVFNGKIFVRQDAQKTNAKQTNKTLLLSDDATINTKPQLEIFADDVKCTHGAAVGQLDEEQVFYLRTRGIGERTARDILTFAFASDVVDRVHSDVLRNRLHGLLQERLEENRKPKR